MQPLSYLNSTGGMIWTAACVLFGILFTWVSYRIINVIPASWLCDYGETPSEELLSGKRVKFLGSGIVVSVITSGCLVLCRLQFNKGFTIYFVLMSLIILISIMIAICDIKYTIIPDQFTIALAVLCLAVSVYDIIRDFGILHKNWWSPLCGALIGAGVMIFIDVLGMIFYKKTGMGFGDVKLFAAVGLLTGFPGTILAFVISLLSATVCFIFIIVLVKIISHKTGEEVKDKSLAENVHEISEESGSSDVPVLEAKESEMSEDRRSLTDESDVSEGVSNADDSVKTTVGTDTDESSEEEKGGGSYFAFGPYIAFATVCYVVFYDFIYNMFDMYMSNFK